MTPVMPFEVVLRHQPHAAGLNWWSADFRRHADFETADAAKRLAPGRELEPGQKLAGLAERQPLAAAALVGQHAGRRQLAPGELAEVGPGAAPAPAADSSAEEKENRII